MILRVACANAWSSAGPMAVSYTHLDVYKRQEHGYVRCASESGILKYWNIWNTHVSNIPIIDVYKRQEFAYGARAVAGTAEAKAWAWNEALHNDELTNMPVSYTHLWSSWPWVSTSASTLSRRSLM